MAHNCTTSGFRAAFQFQELLGSGSILVLPECICLVQRTFEETGEWNKIQPHLEFAVVLAWSRYWTPFPHLWVWGTYPCSCYWLWHGRSREKIVSTFAAFCFAELVDWLLNKAFLDHNMSLLAATFLVARQCCAEECVPWFSTYMFWFGTTFGPESSWASQREFGLLIQFLTDIVPYEPPACLRVHINKVRRYVCHRVSSSWSLYQFLLAETILKSWTSSLHVIFSCPVTYCYKTIWWKIFFSNCT